MEQQRGRIPIHVQAAVEKEVEKLIKEGLPSKIEQLEEDTFISPAVITVKSAGSVKIATDAIQINKQIGKKQISSAEPTRTAGPDFNQDQQSN